MLRHFLAALPATLLAAASLPAQDAQLDADIRMFTVMAAINVAGYDDGLHSPGDSLVRQAVRQQLAEFDGESRSLLENAYQQFQLDDPAENLSQFVSYALICQPPPTFELEANLPTDLPPDVRRLRPLARIFEQFYREADIEDLWQRYQPAFEQELDRYQAVLAPMMFKTAGYLRISTADPEFASFKVWVDLLGAPNNVNTRLYGGDVQVVAHSSEDVPVDEIRRSFLLHLLDRLSIRYSEEVAKKEVLSRFALFAPALDEDAKSDFQILVTKSLVRAVDTRLMRAPPDEKRARVEQDLREGYILTPYFYERLEEFERNPRAIGKYYGELIGGIDLEREAARLQQTTFVEAPQRPKRSAPPKLSEVDKLLQRGEFLLNEEELEAAREAFLEALKKAGGRHGQAAYGLARTAIAEADPDLAREHFLQAAEWTDDAHLRAMSHIYIGRIEDIVGNREQAVAHYRLALQAGDSSERTKQLAEQGLEAPFRRPRGSQEQDR